MNKILKWGCISVGGFIALVMIIGSAASNNNSEINKPTNDQEVTINENATKPTETTIPVIEPSLVDIKQFVGDFDKNQLAAEEKYKGKTVQITGYIKNISEDILGNPFLSVVPSNEKYYFGTSIQCIFNSKSELTNVENTQKVTIIGKVESQDLGIIRIKDCRITAD